MPTPVQHPGPRGSESHATEEASGQAEARAAQHTPRPGHWLPASSQPSTPQPLRLAQTCLLLPGEACPLRSHRTAGIRSILHADNPTPSPLKPGPVPQAPAPGLVSVLPPGPSPKPDGSLPRARRQHPLRCPACWEGSQPVTGDETTRAQAARPPGHNEHRRLPLPGSQGFQRGS